ncbi:AI-2E family transporter [candidate division WWE3 bacterium]|nr:AI-2E family transporter [candidate division WWE3 bacterium]
MGKEIVISVKTILISLGILAGLYVTYELRGVLAILLIAVLLVISIEPAVKYFSTITVLNKPLSRSAAVFIVYALLILILALTFTTAVPMLVNQSQSFVENFSYLFSNVKIAGQSVLEYLSFLNVLEELTKERSLSSIVLNSVSFVMSLFTLVVVSIYMSLDWANIKERFLVLFRGKARQDANEVIHEIEHEVGAWVKGQLILMLAVGLSSFVGFLLAGISYPVALGFIAAVLEIVPLLGPFFTAVIAVAVALAQSPVKAALALGISIAIQQLENNFLVPKIMQKVSGFSPLVILIALLVGTEFFDVLGALLAVPVTMILRILFVRFVHYPHLEE